MPLLLTADLFVEPQRHRGVATQRGRSCGRARG